MRLTSNTPQGNLEQSLNLFYAKDGKTWVRGYGENGTDITLLDLMRKLIRQYAQPDEVPETMSDEDVMFALVDWLYGGTDSMEGVLALLYLAGWVCAELREFLKRFEDKEPMTDEYIERETLLERAEYDNNYRLIIPAEAIKDAPAADVAPVVRCENCASGIMSDDNKYIICCRLGVGMELDDFCSYGAWKNNGGCSEWRKVVDATD